MPDEVKIVVLGDFNAGYHSHWAVDAALFHAANALNLRVEPRWLPTPSLLESNAEDVLAGFDGLWASPGSPYASFEGMLRGIEFARRRDWPFVAT